jgi:hypothetical protein
MIHAFVGFNGSGKTLMALELCVVPALIEGRPVLTNIPLYVERVPWLHARGSRVEVLRELSQLLGPEPGTVVLLDEIATVFPSRSWSSMPGQIHAALQQLRKLGVTLAWTAPSWQRADVTLREITLEVTQCKGLLKRKRQRWAPARFVSAVTWTDPGDFVSGKEAGNIMSRRSTIRRVKGTVAHRLYDTLEPVETMKVHVLGEGVCLACGGGRKRPSCHCEPGLGSAPRGAHAAIGLVDGSAGR